MFSQRQLRVALSVLALAVLWQVLDTTPTLFLYDLLVPSSKPFAHRTIWVTGSSSGIGAALVCQLATVGGAQHVVLSARRLEKMQQVIQNCGTNHDTTFSVVYYDALDGNATTRVVQEALESTPNHSIDILVLNSGVYQLQHALETTAQQRQQLGRVNLEAPIELSETLMQMDRWKERGHGHLVVVSSIMAKGPNSLCSFYAATKAAIRSYFQTLSTEEFAWLKVNMVLPGGTSTDMWQNTYGNTVKLHESSMMSAQRVAHLTVKAMAGPTWLFWEVWISKPDGLLYSFMSHYTPGLFYLLNHFVGYVRRAAFDYNRQDIFEIRIVFQFLIDKFLGRLP